MMQIYGTFGPSCAGKETLTAMFQAGLTGMRLNLSHTGLKESGKLLADFQKVAHDFGIVPELLIDMQGPELRIGVLEHPMTLQENEPIMLGIGGVPVPKEILPVLFVGDEVLLDDGKIRLQIMENCGESAKAQVLRGGVLTSRKSIKLKNPNVMVDMPVLTEHDLNNVRLAASYGVTGLMQPFVHYGKQLQEVRKALCACGAESVKIYAKIETMEGVANLENILPYADAIIIARGDLGNDMDLWKLPGVQKEIAETCRQHGVPFVVVTQMLASMENSPVPTRAEVSDIFNAVLDGACGVMVTGETAVGQYPVETITYLANTAKYAENWKQDLKNS